MRNDAYDDPEQVPSLRASREHDEPYPEPELPPPAAARGARGPRNRRRGAMLALLWVLVLALLIALGGLAWWSYRQVALLEAQLVATQESFGRVSEEANGRLSAIRGQVVATESSVTTESEALKLRLKQLERQVAELVTQQQVFSSQQRSLEDQQAGQAKQLEKQDARAAELVRDQQAQQAALAKLAEQGKTLNERDQALTERAQALTERDEALAGAQAKLSARLEEQARLVGSIGSLREDVTALQKRGDASQALQRLEQDLLVLRSQLDNRPANPTSTAEFDAFRAQVTRNISAMQSQIANLQAQLDGR